MFRCISANLLEKVIVFERKVGLGVVGSSSDSEEKRRFELKESFTLSIRTGLQFSDKFGFWLIR